MVYLLTSPHLPAALFTAGVGFSIHFAQLFHPIVGEYDLIGKNPEAANTVRNVDGFTTVHEELKASVSPELELIESRIVSPAKELQVIMKQIRKTITKRDHKVSNEFEGKTSSLIVHHS